MMQSAFSRPQTDLTLIFELFRGSYGMQSARRFSYYGLACHEANGLSPAGPVRILIPCSIVIGTKPFK